MNGSHAAPARPAEGYYETYARWRADPGAYWLCLLYTSDAADE